MAEQRLIDANAFKKYIRNAYEETKNLYTDNGEWAKEITESFCQDIDEQPTIEPERNTGKWELDEKSLRHRCSECLSVASLDDHGKEVLSDYCGVCGSDMRGEQP